MKDPKRIVAKLTDHVGEPKTKHYVGLPPELTGGKDTREPLGTPALLLIEEKPSGVFLYRFASDGAGVGDTWHQTTAEAQEQARFEFGDVLSSWMSVPADVEDVVSFGLRTDHASP